MRHSDCDPAFVCAAGSCVLHVDPDAGAADAAALDMSIMDSATAADADASSTMDAEPDATSMDAGDLGDAGDIDANDGG